MSHEDIHDDDWREEAPLLSSLQGDLLREEVPAGYFEALPGSMMERIRNLDAEAGSQNEDPGPDAREAAPGRQVKRRPRLLWGIAASVVVLAVLGIVFVSQNRELGDADFDLEIQSQLTSVSDDDILDQLGLSDVSEQELYEALGQEAQAAFDEELNGLGQENLLDLLDDLDLDASDLDGIDLDDEFLNELEL